MNNLDSSLLSPRSFLITLALAVLAIASGIFTFSWQSAKVQADAADYGPPYKPPTFEDHHLRRPLLGAGRHPALATALDTSPDLTKTYEQPEPALERLDQTKFSPNGYRYGDPDPCADYRQPDFTTPKWRNTCRIFLINENDCQAFLEFAWSTGDVSVDATFVPPTGCLD